jgi:ketosteroid isomerase-like protein
MEKQNRLLLSVILLLAILVSCSTSKNGRIVKSKQQILQTEKDFEAAVKQEGLIAFAKFAAEDAVINDNDHLIKGNAAIKNFYAAKKSSNVQLVWTPDFVDVSASGDLGYTFGKYTYSVTDSTGKTKDFNGIFHTVWKRQKNGDWKFVWD